MEVRRILVKSQANERYVLIYFLGQRFKIQGELPSTTAESSLEQKRHFRVFIRFLE